MDLVLLGMEQDGGHRSAGDVQIEYHLSDVMDGTADPPLVFSPGVANGKS